MTDAFLEFSDVFHEDLGFLNPGRIKLADNAIQFKNEKTGKLLTIPTKNLESVKWMRLGNKPGLRFATEDGKSHRFGGFKETDFDKIKNFAAPNWKQEVEATELALKGWNFGKCEVNGRSVEFSVDGKPAFEVALHNVSNCVQGKNEATLEFHPNDEAAVCLTEMRFHIPADPDDEEADPVAAFHAAVMRFAGVEAETGQAIANLQQILCTTPRGRYDIKVYANHLSLHGKTYDYKIPINTIMRLFLVPHKDGRHVYFVISLSPPIRQGQTRYHYLVLEFSKEEEVDLELGLSEEQLKEQYNGKLEKELSGPVYEVVSKIFRVLINMKITVPGHFIGHSGTPAISCAHRQASGFLYPLEKGFLYVHKPPMYIRFEEVSSVHFARSDVSTRSFDFEIELKNGQSLVFNSVEKEEYNKLFDYVHNKNLRIRNAKKLEKNYAEDRFAGSDEEPDRYKEAMRQEGREKVASDGEESDKDYDMEKDIKKREANKDSSEGSGSEPDEEYESDSGEDSSGSGESDEEEEEEAPKKKKHKEGKKEKEPKEKKSRKSKKHKDPNAPKRAQSAYFLWLNEKRSEIRKTGDSVSDTAKRAGEMWKAMGEEEKRPWEEKAKREKERYQQEMADYKKSGGGAASSSSKASKKTSPTKSPSKAKSKEFVSDDSDSDDSDDKPLASTKKEVDKKKKEKATKKKEESEEEAEEEEEEASGDSDDSD